ncbi:hypothetical protein OGATHE_006302 [Ogataea polymorpha]|uniref:Uncharacterized protein n=1 Tax=Ogataea polymorpha TaxID=460523 RepID=A0A9P8SY21_9ASCO|nr:hypothetical protein OGATHE_006302 [Ogataea polymorpha]
MLPSDRTRIRDLPVSVFFSTLSSPSPIDLYGSALSAASNLSTLDFFVYKTVSFSSPVFVSTFCVSLTTAKSPLTSSFCTSSSSLAASSLDSSGFGAEKLKLNVELAGAVSCDLDAKLNGLDTAGVCAGCDEKLNPFEGAENEKAGLAGSEKAEEPNENAGF